MSKAETADLAPEEGASPGGLNVGDQIVVTVARPISRDSLLSLEPGDVGTVVSVGDGWCAVSFCGLAVTLPLDAVQRLAGAAAAPPRRRTAGQAA